jgi:putative FmdB family regulatory protein
VPVYVFRCPACGEENEQLLRLGDTDPRPCPTPGCDGTATLRFSRVAVKYDAFGFTSTDTLGSDRPGRSFKDLRSKAEEIADG